jgi:hypothetical protein
MTVQRRWEREQLHEECVAKENAKNASLKRMSTQLFEAAAKSKIGVSEWERNFINSVYLQISKGNALSVRQEEMLTKLFEKY